MKKYKESYTCPKCRCNMIINRIDKETQTVTYRCYKCNTYLFKPFYTHTNKHRNILQKLFGRKLSPEQHIHHLDGNHTNNDVNNLKICSSAKSHHAFHTVMKKSPDLYKSIIGITSMLLFIILATTAYADLQKIDNALTVSIDDNKLVINGDGLSYRKDLNIIDFVENNQTIKRVTEFTENFQQSFYKNITYQESVDIRDFRGKVENITVDVSKIKENMNYYDRYTHCFANLTSNMEANKKNENVLGQWQACTTQLGVVNTDLEVKEHQLNGLNNTMQQCTVDRSNKSGLMWLFGIIAAALAARLVWQHFDRKPFKNRAADPDVKSVRTVDP